ncbi:hypothetical protein [Deinococcus sp. QL22]|uniref:hypothetical protein n=1 Tax=Deinococcus sp. QL22 TaxID=2939437 RepID=UPI00201704D3|nr:hypothetical protein [Deinococcus sp. QL22]UQN09292.1 hypothetical protein M1R55_22215 [Deinococcus sp. QL22]
MSGRGCDPVEGRIGGRRPKLPTLAGEELIRSVREERYSMAKAARLFGVHPSAATWLMAQV